MRARGGPLASVPGLTPRPPRRGSQPRGAAEAAGALLISYAVEALGSKSFAGGAVRSPLGSVPRAMPPASGAPAAPHWGAGCTGRRQLESGRTDRRQAAGAGGGEEGVGAGREARPRRRRQMSLRSNSGVWDAFQPRPRSPEPSRSPGLSRGGTRPRAAFSGRGLPPLRVGRPAAAPVLPPRAPRCPRWGLRLVARRVAPAGPAPRARGTNPARAGGRGTAT